MPFRSAADIPLIGRIRPRPREGAVRRASVVSLIGFAVAACSEPVASPVAIALRSIARPNAVVTSSAAYTAIDLGTFGGTDGEAIGVNAAGQVTGWASGPGGQWYRAFFWENGALTDLGALGGNHSYPFQMNEAGVVVGWATVDPSGTPYDGFRWQNGILSDLGKLPGFQGSQATAINDRGQIAGESWRNTTNPSQLAVLWDGGNVAVLPALGGSTSSATAINSAGEIAGQSRLGLLGPDHAVLWRNGVLVDLGTLGDRFSGFSSFATDLNDAGQVAGVSTLAWFYHAFRWSDGVMTDLGSLDGGLSWALGINARGDVCGYSTAADGRTHAVLWRDNTLIDLGMLPGGISAMATDINDAGQVIGTMYFADGGSRAFLWENGVITALGTLGGNRASVQTRRAISSAGHIVGQAETASGEMHPVLWQPGIVVTIDVKPGSTPNAINPKSNGLIPVAILSTASFDATTVDASSVRFGPGNASEAHRTGHIEDVNGDGSKDMVLHFDTRVSGIVCTTTSVALTGRTTGAIGTPIRGTDAIVTTGCH